jgi:hypothetical protein
MPEYSSRSMAFANAATMRIMAEQIARSDVLELEGRPFTIQAYDAMSNEDKRKVLASFFIQEWDAKSQVQKTKELREMPPECHVCGQDKPSTSTDASVGYTRLICSDCVMQAMLR